jgi:hypothetical protein
LRDATASEDRITDEFQNAAEQKKTYDPDTVRYGWPGSITQTIEQAYISDVRIDPDGTSRNVSPFHQDPSLCGDATAVFPRVLKAPLGSGDLGRQPLRAAADAALGVQGHYRFFAYTDSAKMAQSLLQQPTTATWALGTNGLQCSSSIWNAFTTANTGVTLEGQLEPQELAFSGMLQSDVDGLYGYTAGQRLSAAMALYSHIYDDATTKSGTAGAALKLFGIDFPDAIANTVVNCFASDSCDSASADWRSGVGPGTAVSPDNMMMWDIYSNNEALEYVPTDFARVYRLAASAGAGTVTGHVVDINMQPVADVDLVFAGALDTVSDTTGAFRFDAIAAGTYSLNASTVVNGLTENGKKDVVVTAGQTTDVTIVISSDQTHRMINIIGIMPELRDIDNIGDSFIGPVPIEYHLKVDPITKTNSATFDQCVDHDVRMLVAFSVTLQDDLESVQFCVAQGAFEDDGAFADDACTDSKSAAKSMSSPLCFLIGPDGQGSADDGGGINSTDPGNISGTWNVTVTNTVDVEPPAQP